MIASKKGGAFNPFKKYELILSMSNDSKYLVQQVDCILNKTNFRKSKIQIFARNPITIYL